MLRVRRERLRRSSCRAPFPSELDGPHCAGGVDILVNNAAVLLAENDLSALKSAPRRAGCVGHWVMARSPSLFAQDLPPGFHYRHDFITETTERDLLAALAHVAFSDFEMHGVVARRRVAFFGQSYDRMTAAPLPA